MASNPVNRKKLGLRAIGITFLALGLVWLENDYGIAFIAVGLSFLMASYLRFRSRKD